MKSGFEQQTNFFKKKQEESESVTKAALVVSSLIAKRMKPFTDAEFIKECTLAIVNEVCPEKKVLFDSIPLSARTVTRKVEIICEHLKLQLKNKGNDFNYFSLAFDESTDASDTAQLAIFIRGITHNFDVIGEFAELIPMKGTTRGEDIAQAILECTGRMQLDLSKFASATTDSAPAMIGSHIGAIAVLQNHVASLGFSNTIIKLRCITHQKVLASKVTHLNMTGVMSTVVKIINFILARGLNHCQFKSLLEEMNAQYQDVYFCEVRWLSRGAMLQRFYNLGNKTMIFLRQKNASFGINELGDPDWLTDLAFLTDFTLHMNKLNLQLQAKEQFINRMYDYITAFVNKLRLWETQLINSNFARFPNLGLCKPANSDK